MSYGWPDGFKHLSEQKLALRHIVRQQTSHLINALRTDVSLNTEPEHGQNNETDDAEIAEPESK